MQITPLAFDPRCISMSVERDALRSPGIHLSSILKDRLITAGIERRVKGSKPFTPQEQHLIFERGFLWERMVAEFVETEEWLKLQIEEAAHKHLKAGIAEITTQDPARVLVRPGECCLDGIYMTPDALNMSEYAIEEWKATAIRYKGFDVQARRMEWLWQAAAYAHVFGMTKAIIRVWHVSDNVLNSMKIEWTPEEVRENWQQILEHYQYMLRRKQGAA